MGWALPSAAPKTYISKLNIALFARLSMNFQANITSK